MDHPGAGMSLITTSREELLDRTEVAFTRFRELVADVPADIRVGDGTWLTSDVAGHVAGKTDICNTSNASIDCI